MVYLIDKDVFQTRQRLKKKLRVAFGVKKVGHPRMDKELCECRREKDHQILGRFPKGRRDLN